MTADSAAGSLDQTTINTPQAIAAPAGRAAIFMVLGIKDDAASVAAVRAFGADLGGLVRSVARRDGASALSCVMGVGSDAWDRLYGAPRPAHLHTLREIRSATRIAPSTPGDLLFHIRAVSQDFCFELARVIMEKLDGAVFSIDEVHGFRYFDARSMVGFVDGTENPVGSEAMQVTTVSPGEDPEFCGGSYVIVQKYLHDMAGWNKLPVEEQERIIGRRKLDDVELEDNVKPSNAHNALTNITDENGNELKIVRDNLPFGSPATGEFGTYFIGYARDPAVTERMLQNMFVGDPPGNYDRLLDFSTAVTGTLFFVPSVPLLEALAEREPRALGIREPSVAPSAATVPEAPEAPSPAPRPTDGSIAIGSLKNAEPNT